MTIWALMVLGEVSVRHSWPLKKSLSIPDGPKKHFAKFKKNRKLMIFQDFLTFSGSGAWSSAAEFLQYGGSCGGREQVSASWHSVSAAPTDFLDLYHLTLPGTTPAVFLSRLPGRTRPQRPAAADLGKKTFFLHNDTKPALRAPSFIFRLTYELPSPNPYALGIL